MWQIKNISTTTKHEAIKLNRFETFYKGLPPIKPHDSWITSFCKIIWQNKKIYPLPQCLCQPILAQWGINEEFPSITCHDPLVMCYISSFTKPMPTKYGKDVTGYEGILPITCSPWSRWSDKVTSQVKNISSLPMAKTFCSVVKYCKELQLVKLHEPLIMWSWGIMWQIKNFIYPLTPNWAASRHTVWGFYL